MRKLMILASLLSLPLLASADVVRVMPESGAFVQHAGAHCDRGFKDTVLAIARTTLTVDDGMVYRGGTHADEVVQTSFGTWAFWRSSTQTLVVSVRPKRGTDRKDVEISIIDRSGGQVCYEKWRGYGQ